MPARLTKLTESERKGRVLCRGNRTEVAVFEERKQHFVRKRLHDFANVSTERVALYYEALLQRAAQGPGVVSIIDARFVAVDRLHEVGEVPTEIDAFERQFIDGHSLRELSRPSHRHHLKPRRCVRWVAVVAQTLDRVHALVGLNDEPLGLVHRDVTWDNILIDREELSEAAPGEGVYLNDFGLAFVSSWGKLALDETLQGATRFLCPELKAGLQPSAACDIYQLGLTLCFLLGTIRGLDPPELFEKGFSNPVNARARDLLRPLGVEACLDTNPNHRPTAKEFGQLLERAANSLDLEA